MLFFVTRGLVPRVFFRPGPSRGCLSPAIASVTVARGPVPRHASVGTGNGVGWRAFFAQVVRSRGTGPRATVFKAVSLSP